MIKNFRHKGLEKFFINGIVSGIQPKHRNRIRLILGRLHASDTVQDMNLPGLHLHTLKGKDKGRYSVRVSGNWRITFSFRHAGAHDVDYQDYH